MKYIEGLMDDYTMDRDSAVTLGKFDGLHLGHQQLIRRICEKEKEGLESVVVTIWPNPKNPALLTKGEKKELLKKMGVSWWIDCPFLPEISHMSSEDFVRDILVKRLRKHRQKGNRQIICAVISTVLQYLQGCRSSRSRHSRYNYKSHVLFSFLTGSELPQPFYLWFQSNSKLLHHNFFRLIH